MNACRIVAIALRVALCAALAGCASMQTYLTVEAYREGRALAAEGRIEESLAKFQEAIRQDPSRAQYRAAYQTTRERAVNSWLALADRAKSSGQAEAAEQLYRRVLAIDAGNARARAALDDAERDKRHAVLYRQAQLAWAKGDAPTALGRLREILTANPRNRAAAQLQRTIEEKTVKAPVYPKLDNALRKPITIEFRNTPLRQVMEVFSRTSGINFVFDKDVRPDLRATIFLRNTTVRDALAMVLLTNQLEHRVLDASSIVIYPNTAAKAREYRRLTVRTFFLDYGDVKTAATTLRTILKTRDLIIDEKQNMIIMRDTPEAVRLAEKLIALHDLAEPEVMLEVEILEVKRTRLQQLGVQWPGQLTLTPLSTTGGTTLTLEDLRNISSSSLGAGVSPLIINLNKQDGDVNLLANPRIRSKNRETARILVGDRVPNITTTATSTGFVSESVTYVDVGLKLEVEPVVSMNDEISIKVGLEVSNIVEQIQTRSGSLAYRIGTRSASTVLRLNDGENQVLAGLINDVDRNSGNKVPALGEIPILGRLFGAQRDESEKTEIVLSITPRIIRNPPRPSLKESEFDAGTEASLSNRGLRGAVPRVPTRRTSKPVTAASLARKPAGAAGTPGSPGDGPGSYPTPGSGTAATGGAGTIIGAPIGTVGGTVTGPSPIVTAGATSFTFQGPAQAAAGTSFDLVLSVLPDQPITSLPFSLGYDPKLIEVAAVTEGDFMRQGGASSNFITKIDTSAGRVFGTATRGSGDGASQTGTLLTLRVRALTANSSTTVQLIAASPIGVGGRAVTIQAPAPYQLQITP
jgi:general secretion pathway protein D